MSKREFHCGVCGARLIKVRMHSEEILVGTTDERVIAAQRNFKGHCKHHGEVWAQNLSGHHSTLGEKRFKQYFSKSKRARLKRHLDANEWRRFQAALHGKLSPSPDELAYWKRLAVEPIVSPISRWLGG